MATENEEDDVQGQQEQQDNKQISTGNDDWDKLIDDAAQLGTSEKKPAEKGAQEDGAGGKTADGTAKEGEERTQQQRDPRQQQQGDDDARRQGNAQGPGTDQTYAVARKFGDSFFAGHDGNIYDARGTKVASQGSQRAVFHRVWPTIQAQERELTGLRSRVESYENANTLAKKEGLSLDEHGAALQMFVQFKKDPVKTLQTLLTHAEQSGRDISAIRQSTGPSMADFRSTLEEVVDARLKRFDFITEQQERQREQATLAEEVQTQYAEFIEQFPDARVHEAAIANVMRDKGVNEREAYYAIRAFAAERGLDWKQPLAEQLVAQEQRRNPSGDGKNRQKLPPMGGRGRIESNHVAAGSREQANANDSWDKIGQEVMRDLGLITDG